MQTVGKIRAGHYLFLTVSGFIAFFSVLVATSKYGPAISHDSVAYLYASVSFLEGRGFEYFGYPSPFIQWPPLFPFLLSAAGAVGIGPAAASQYLNAVTHGLIIFTSGAWLFAKARNQSIAILGTLLIVFSVPLIRVSRYVWTESLFILFLLLLMLCLEKYRQSSQWRYLIGAGVFAALACLDRYIGVTMILTAAIFLFLRKKGLAMRLKEIVLFGSIASLPTIIWAVRNYLVSGTFAGVRLPSTYPLGVNISRTLKACLSWVLPVDGLQAWITRLPHGSGLLRLVTWPAAFLLMIAVIAIVVYIIYGWLRKLEISSAAFLLVFSAIYMAYLVASATSVLFEPITGRYVVPVFLPLLLILLLAADHVNIQFSLIKKARVLSVVLIVILSGALGYFAANTAYEIKDTLANGAGGFTTTNWVSNKLLHYIKIRETGKGTVYFSNYADAIYARTGIHAYSSPKKDGPPMYGIEQFKSTLQASTDSYLVWFNKPTASAVYQLEDFQRLYELVPVEENADGWVYRIIKEK